MSFGVTSAGFVKKPLAVLVDDLIQDIKDGSVNPNLNFLAQAAFGNLVNSMGDRLSEVWDVMQFIWANTDPNAAEDQGLNSIGVITGAYRIEAKASTVTLDQLYLDAAATIPAGKIVSVGDEGVQFKLLISVTNGGSYRATVSALAECTITGPNIGYATQINKIQTPVSGWKQNAGITGTELENFSVTVDDELVVSVDEGANQTVTITSTTSLDAAALIALLEAEIPGATGIDAGGYIRLETDSTDPGNSINIISGELVSIIGFSTGLIKGFNSADAVVGNNIESNPAFRVRRIELLKAIGAATVDAIRASLLTVDDVLKCIVYENYKKTVDAFGLPAASFESIVEGGDSDEIGQMIWDKKPAGIEPHGDITTNPVDSRNVAQSVDHSTPVYVPIYIKCVLDVDWDLFPADGETQVQLALKAYGDSLDIGEDLYILRFKCIPISIAGVLDVTTFYISTVDPPVLEDNITIDFNELATFALADIDVSLPLP